MLGRSLPVTQSVQHTRQMPVRVGITRMQFQRNPKGVGRRIRVICFGEHTTELGPGLQVITILFHRGVIAFQRSPDIPTPIEGIGQMKMNLGIPRTLHQTQPERLRCLGQGIAVRQATSFFKPGGCRTQQRLRIGC